MLFRSSAPRNLPGSGFAADGLVADDQGLRGLPGLGSEQGVCRRGRGGQQRDRHPSPPVDEQESA